MSKTEEVDFAKYLHILIANRRTIYKVIGLGLLIGIIIAFSIPKTYTVKTILSPESGQSNNNSLSSMASMFGVNGIGSPNQDAVNSSMFPDIIVSTPFILEMYNVPVKTNKQHTPILLSDYVMKEKRIWWEYIPSLPSIILNSIKSLLSSKEKKNEYNKRIDAFRLTPEQSSKITAIKKALSASVDSKNNMTSISASFQDPEVAAIVADSTVAKLQKYIIDYRTRKAQDDCNYLEKLCKDRKNEYLKAQQVYADFMDANRIVILQRTQAEGTRLQNDMSIAFQVYSQVETQLQVARAKVQEAKPVFAIVEPASIPLGPSSPNKPLIIIVSIFLSFIGGSFWILFGKDLWNNIRTHKNN